MALSAAQSNRARAHAEADRAIVVDNRMAEHATQLAGRAIMRKLARERDWISRSALRRSLTSKYRDCFEDAMAALVDAGQVGERAIQTENSTHEGTEYRSTR